MKKKETSAKSYLKSVGENIKHYRRQRGLSLDVLGLDIGLDKSNMHKIEAGKNITLLTLLKLAVVLKASITQVSTIEKKRRESLRIPFLNI
ncbi:MAG TPA: helix-turn-helix transcriptional regulator [Bacteroidia bacterium]|nr:helix-turn-helix transcriptional regulator [Bacteroidia bacterium]HRH09613.1 helix-turn-helix transcriptional regulator [Bacteroidia bacterium]